VLFEDDLNVNNYLTRFYFSYVNNLFSLDCDG